MEIIELRNQIIEKSILHPFIFSGTEAGIKDIYVKQLSSIWDAEINNQSSVLEVMQDMRNGGLIERKKQIYVVREDKEIIKNEELWEKLEKDFPNLILILIYEVVDGRTTFSKHFENNIVEFKSLNAVQLARYISKIGLTSERAEMLAINCGLDYLTCQQEENKLLNFKQVRGLDINSAFDLAMGEKILCVKWTDLFDKFILTVLGRDVEQALTQWNYLRQTGESEFKALMFVYNQFKNLLLMLSGNKINPFFERQLLPFKNFFNLEEVEIIIELIQKLDRDVKLGRMEVGIMMEYLLVSIG